MLKVIIVVSGLLLPAYAGTALAQSPPRFSQLLRPEMKTQAGLDGLTSAQQATLDAYVAAYAQVVGSMSTGSSGRVVESYIDGEFHGWDGETIYKLDNGQVWQQSSYSYSYSYSYHPKVLVYASSGGFKMHVEGSSGQDVSVQRLK